jgi:hypothetical protein
MKGKAMRMNGHTRTWTIDERIQLFERKGIITPPLLDNERSTVAALAAAWFYVWELSEMPARFAEKSSAGLAMDMAITRFLMHKERGPMP